MRRRLPPDLKTWILAKVANWPEYRAAVAARDGRALFLIAMRSFVGIREAGDNRGRMVELLQRTVGGAVHEPWCMSAVQSALAFAEKISGKPSPIAVSEHCLIVWRQTPIAQRVKVCPLPGAIIIWRHGNTDNGHTGATLTRPVNRMLDALEGNTLAGIAGGRIIRDGGGFYQTWRSQDGNGDMRVVGFLKPF